jgi:D-psicose/D-tagatose/L-ribulose 3-epimerase
MWVDKTIPDDHSITGLRLEFKKFTSILSKTGYNGVEIMMGNPFSFDFKEVKKIVYDTNLEISQLCTGEFRGTYNLCLNDINKEKRKEALLWAEKVISLASILNCSVNIGRFRGRVWEDGFNNSINRMVHSFRYLDKKAKEQNIEILIEPLRKDICDNLNSVLEVSEFIKNYELQSFYIMIDTDHTSIKEIEYIQNNISCIKYIHLADTMHVPLGEGIISFSEYFKLFKSLRYDGYMSIEVFSNNYDENIIKKSMLYLKRFIQKEGRQWNYKGNF